MINKTNAMGAAACAPIVAGTGDRPAALKFDVVHHLPGRLRLRTASLKGDARGSDKARRYLARIEGVTSVTANPGTGSLLVEYDTAVLRPADVVGVLVSHGDISAAPAKSAESGAGWSDHLANAVKDWMIDALADRLAMAMIGLLA
jgi:copper chaperone CopZ